MVREYRDDPPWYLEVGEDFSKKAADRIARRIQQDVVKNGEGAGLIASMSAVVPVVGQIVAIAATCVSIYQMIQTQQKLANLRTYVRSSQELNALYQGELDEEVLAGTLELERLKEELAFVRTVRKAYINTLLISGGLVFTALTIIIIKNRKK